MFTSSWLGSLVSSSEGKRIVIAAACLMAKLHEYDGYEGILAILLSRERGSWILMTTHNINIPSHLDRRVKDCQLMHLVTQVSSHSGLQSVDNRFNCLYSSPLSERQTHLVLYSLKL